MSTAKHADASRRNSALSGWSVRRRLGARDTQFAAKRLIDILSGVGFGVVTLPAMLLIAAAIRLDSPGPALFKAKRIGRHGKPFAMYKFRTMVHGAEERLHEVAHLNVANGMIKIPDDPRVTRTGKWLRRFSLDELPQIYNILAGHMSLVGPRPHDLGDLRWFSAEHDPRLAMRPGLTGLWQVSARSDPNLETRIRWDTQYVNQWSLSLDAVILARTVPTVVLAKGGAVDVHRKSTSLTLDALMSGPQAHTETPDLLAGSNQGLVGPQVPRQTTMETQLTGPSSGE